MRPAGPPAPDRAVALDVRRGVEDALHGLSQPLTTLRCRLEMALLLGDSAALHEAVDAGIRDLDAAFAWIATVRDRLHHPTTPTGPHM